MGAYLQNCIPKTSDPVWSLWTRIAQVAKLSPGAARQPSLARLRERQGAGRRVFELAEKSDASVLGAGSRNEK
jgi:hypothetical protein